MSLESAVLDVGNLSDTARARARQRALAGAAAETRHRRHVTGWAVGLTAATAAGLLTYPSVAPTSAYASWTAVPRPVSISADDPRVHSCENSLPVGPAESVGSAQRLAPVVAESRGRFTAALLGAGDSIAICVFDDATRTGGRTVSAPLSTGQSISLVGNGGSLDDGGIRYAYGRVSEAVASVHVVTTDGLRVTATVSMGYYLAWWPSNAGPMVVTASDARGSVLAEAGPA